MTENLSQKNKKLVKMATEVASNSEILSSPEQPSRINSLSSNDDCIELMTRAYAKGTIHILRKHLYSTKLNLMPNFLQKEFVFQHNILTKFSCSNLKFLLLITCSRHRNLQNIRIQIDQ